MYSANLVNLREPELFEVLLIRDSGNLPGAIRRKWSKP